MATKDMAYDHPAYQVVMPLGFHLTGSGGTGKFAAWSTMLVKSYQVTPFTAGTSNDVVTVYKLSGTTTTTHAIATFGSGSQTTQNVVGTFTLAKGDAISIVKGTDATAVLAAGIELAIVPTSVVTS